MSNAAITKLRTRTAGDRRWRLIHAGLLMLERFLYSDEGRNRAAPFVRQAVSVQGNFNNLLIASLPCWLIGLWNIGYQSNRALDSLELESLAGWRGNILQGLGIGFQPDSLLACLIHGLLYFAPLFVLVLLVSAFWEALFATMRRRSPDEGLLAFAWLFTLLLPAGTPLLPVMLGVSFGMIFGKHIYGGSGFYLVNPVVVGLVFLWLAYPSVVFGPDRMIPVSGVDVSAALNSTQDWWAAFSGARPGTVGTTSVLGCVVGAGYLLITRSASGRIMLGSLLGILLAAQVFGAPALSDAPELTQLSVGQHLLSGGLTFGIVFLATDPYASCMTNPGRWIYGFSVGILAILIGLANPGVGEPVLFAIFMASLVAPLIDASIVAMHKARRRRRIDGVMDQ